MLHLYHTCFYYILFLHRVWARLGPSYLYFRSIMLWVLTFVKGRKYFVFIFSSTASFSVFIFESDHHYVWMARFLTSWKCYAVTVSSFYFHLHLFSTETNGASFQMIRKDYVCCCFLSELLIRKTTHFLTVSYCSFFRNLPLRNMHNPKIFFPVFFPVFSSLITEMYPFIYVFAQMRRVKGTYHMNILLHTMILYYMVYTYKTKYTCLFLRPVNIPAVLPVLLEGFSIMRFIRFSVKVL